LCLFVADVALPVRTFPKFSAWATRLTLNSFSGRSFTICPGCNESAWCSQECANANWKVHTAHCKQSKATSDQREQYAITDHEVPADVVERFDKFISLHHHAVHPLVNAMFGLCHGEPAIVESNVLLIYVCYNKAAVDIASQFSFLQCSILKREEARDHAQSLPPFFGEMRKVLEAPWMIQVRWKLVRKKDGVMGSETVGVTTGNTGPPEPKVQQYCSQTPEKSFDFALEGIPCETNLQADVRSALRERRWGASKCE
jgi:hypothetical protein